MSVFNLQMVRRLGSQLIAVLMEEKEFILLLSSSLHLRQDSEDLRLFGDLLNPGFNKPYLKSTENLLKAYLNHALKTIEDRLKHY